MVVAELIGPLKEIAPPVVTPTLTASAPVLVVTLPVLATVKCVLAFACVPVTLTVVALSGLDTVNPC